ncbi:unnamed protein product [Merluccius merluccius]
MEVVDDLDFPRRQPTKSDQLTVAQVLALGPLQQVGVIEARVLQATANRVVQVRGAPVELKVFEICDATGLTVWDRLILSVQEGRSYRFTTLTTRKEGDRTVLTTTPSTLVRTAAEVGQPATLRPAHTSSEEVVRRPVAGVKIVAKPRCPRCHVGQDNLAPKCSTHRCERCAILQRTNGYIISYSGVVIVVGRDGVERSLSLTNSAVYGYVRDHFLASCAHDGAALKESVMALSEAEVTVSGEGLVVRFGGSIQAEPLATAPVGESTQPEASDSRASEAESDTEGLDELFRAV